MKLYSFLNSFISNFFPFSLSSFMLRFFFPLNYRFRNVDFSLRQFVFTSDLQTSNIIYFIVNHTRSLLLTKTADQKTYRPFLTSITIISLLRSICSRKCSVVKCGWHFTGSTRIRKKLSTIKMHPVYNKLRVEPGNVSQLVSNMLLSVF